MAAVDATPLEQPVSPDAPVRSGDVPTTSARLAARFDAAFPQGAPHLPEANHRRGYQWLVFGMFVVYVAIAVGFYLWRGVAFTPDKWAIFLLVGAIVLGRVGPFIRDWIPFVLLIFGYEFLRGVAGDLVVGDRLAPGQRISEMERSDFPSVHLEGLIAFDRSLLFGHEPVSTLQGWLYERGTVHWYDYFAVLVYSMHFILPCLFAFALWLGRKGRFWHFTLTFCFMTYAAFACFLFFPAAPPWLADAWGVVSGIGWPQGQVTASIGIRGIRTLDTYAIWQNASPHPVAAMPSLHAGFPWLVMLFALRYFGRWGLLFIPYNLALWFAVVYTSNHWIVDILVGIAWATVSFAIVDLIWHALTVDGFAGVPAPIRRGARAVASAFGRAGEMLRPPWRRVSRRRA